MTWRLSDAILLINQQSHGQHQRPVWRYFLRSGSWPSAETLTPRPKTSNAACLQFQSSASRGGRIACSPPKNCPAIRRSACNSNLFTQLWLGRRIAFFDGLQNHQHNGADQHHGGGRIESRVVTAESGGLSTAVNCKKQSNSGYRGFETERHHPLICLIGGSLEAIDDESTNSAHSCTVAARDCWLDRPSPRRTLDQIRTTPKEKPCSNQAKPMTRTC